ncbi:hypothetical protein FQN53_000887 [Emmonsiellopsis sp. PD_33]|nr:hypothetical protein FQN53_000887 [Emmonsiellopsis sp. PD_33]
MTAQIHTAATNPPPHAPWRALFQSHISKLSSPEFSFSTVYQDPNGKIYPRVRTCVFRGFWAQLDLRDSAKAMLLKDETDGNKEIRLNPGIYESDMLTFTTDVRMEKVGQIHSINDDGGGQVEGVFWVKDAMTQWRIRGRAFVTGGDSHGADEISAKESIRKWMRLREGGENDDTKIWSWEREITTQFANLSPIMRGSFKNPPPGTPIPNSVPNPGVKLGQRVDDLHDPVARANFRVVVIIPEEVESVDLTSPEQAKRIRWTLAEKDEDPTNASNTRNEPRMCWKAVELWP